MARSELGNRLPYLDLKQIVSNVQPEGDESAQRLVSIFLWQKGKFKKFLQLIQARNKNGFDTYFEAAMDMPLDQIVPIWQLYLKSVAFNKNEIMTLPVSTVFATEPEFRQFKNTHKQSID